MTINLYLNVLEKNVVSKSPILKHTLEGTLRAPSSVINPIILIELDDNVMFTNESVNYVGIPTYSRYYFINEIVCVRDRLFELHLKVDVLYSFKNGILNLNAYISRSASHYNELIKDDLVPYEYPKQVSEEYVAVGPLVNTTFSTTGHTRNFMLSCASFMTIPMAYDIEPPVESLNRISQLYYTDQFSTTAYILQPHEAEYVTYQALQKQAEVGSFIKSLIAYPFELTPNQDDPSYYPLLFVGNTQIKTLLDEDLYVPYSKYRLSQYLVIADFTMDSPTSFEQYEPYTMYELFVPYCSWISLESNKILGKRIIVYYSVQYEDGSANAYVYNVTDSMLLWSGSCQLGVKIGITTSNAQELTAQKNANNLNMTLGLVSSVASVGLGIGSGNSTAVVGGIISGAKTIGNFVNTNSLMFDRAQATFSSGPSGMYTDQLVKLRTTKYKAPQYTDNFTELYGRPCNQYKNLNTLRGFTQVDNIHIQGIKNAYSTELDEIEDLLKTGVIL